MLLFRVPNRDIRVRPWPDPAKLIGDDAVDILLEYNDYIPAKKDGEEQSGVKQTIRRVFADTLRRTWRDSPQLSGWQKQGFVGAKRGPWAHEPDDQSVPFFMVPMFGFSLIPLISWHNGLGCDLEITLKGDKRSALKRRGDIDNRLKVLFDALRMPLRHREVPGNMFGSGADQFFCLLEDDSLIRKFSVEAIQSGCSPAEHSAEIRAHVIAIDGTHEGLNRFR
jgi:hypothetical protein